MTNQQKLLPDKEPVLPKDSMIILVVHLGMGLFFVMAYFLLYSNIETFKMLILGYYTLFSVFFLFFYQEQLRVKRVFWLWCAIGFLQLVVYFINANSLMWGKWSFGNVLTALCGLPVVLALYHSFRRMSLQREGKELVIGIRKMYKPTKWDIAATITIPLVALLVCLF
ncbi:hypothetical protein BDD43_2070 [Mucilaginibacter gracilis]|uniref:Uncharacterized protein n=1 Tax=Mucilaginibacter gracilis TaxID=423350 RepID=A0A495J0L8_9SPHI|nr:hypothetical protein [Mucilaginibacter gracilis]RKR81908.1 hypothetical protein BDD43_2070 [Mucilaginibacter gracilis]